MIGHNLILDANTALYLLNGDKTLSELLYQKNLHNSFITEIELLGYHKLTRKEKEEILQFIDDCIVINCNQEIRKKTITL